MIIDILTTTRAEYGLMRPLIQSCSLDEDIHVRLLVTGTHLLEDYGMTYKEIEQDGFPIYKKVNIMGLYSGMEKTSEIMSNALKEFTKHFITDKPDFLLVDGDRYETMAVCLAAFNTNTPIIHLSGGATTEGAADEFYRHAISKMAYLHFPTTKAYRKRIIQMGENPNRVFAVGSLGIENILKTDLLSLKGLEESIGYKLDQPFSVVTFHPVTLEGSTHISQLNELLDAVKSVNDMKFIFTMANADHGGNEINEILKKFVEENKQQVFCVSSLGSKKYLSALKHCEFVLGNSSSGLIEAPTFKIPTVNIGDRQSGRIKAESVIDCKPEKNDILQAIKRARSIELKDICSRVINPNGDGKTSDKIINRIKQYCNLYKIDIKKKFYDIDFKMEEEEQL